MRYVHLVILVLLVAACGTPAKFPISFPSSKNVDDRIIGKWKFEEDTNKNNYYEISKSVEEFQYHVRFFDRGGTNPTYEANVFFSNLNGVKFLNVPYYEKTTDPKYVGGMKNMGYFFLKISEANEDFSRLVTYTVTSKELSKIDNWRDLTRYIYEHEDDNNIFTNKAHFYKIK